MKHLICIFLVAGCARTSGVRVTREGDNYAVSIGYCDVDVPDQLLVSSIYVGMLSPNSGQAVEDQCELTGEHGAQVLQRWIYGTAPPQYKLSHCGGLTRGKSYELRIGLRPRNTQAAYGQFAIDDNGDVQMIEGNCQKKLR